MDGVAWCWCRLLHPWGRKESNTTERLHFHLLLVAIFTFLSTFPIKLKLLVSTKQGLFTFKFLEYSIKPRIYEVCINY